MDLDLSDVSLETLDDGIAIVTLDRPDRLNAWTSRMEQDLSRVFRWCDGEDAIRGVVVTGAGRAFCAGADLSSGESRFSEAQAAPVDPFHPWDVRKPVVAAVNGHAVGVGMSFSMACDIRFVSSSAKLGFVFARRGVLSGFASHATLLATCGASVAADLLFSGRTFTGDEAVSLELASSVHEADRVLPHAVEWLRETVREAAPLSIAVSKRLLWERIDPARMKAREDALFAWLGQQPDAREGVRAFLAKTAPEWAGDLDSLAQAPFGSPRGDDPA